MEDVKARIDEYNRSLALNSSISIPAAEKKAAVFLEALAYIADVKHLLSNEKIKLLSSQTAVYAEQMSKGDAKTVTENKLRAEASRDYTRVREAYEAIDNDISYLKAHVDIYTNAHIFYRNLCKGEI